jgi:hypothetical protein
MDDIVNAPQSRLEAENAKMREAVVIACRSGKFGNPEKAAERIIACVAATAAPQGKEPRE